jgi:hypothetical protein
LAISGGGRRLGAVDCNAAFTRFSNALVAAGSATAWLGGAVRTASASGGGDAGPSGCVISTERGSWFGTDGGAATGSDGSAATGAAGGAGRDEVGGAGSGVIARGVGAGWTVGAGECGGAAIWSGRATGVGIG